MSILRLKKSILNKYFPVSDQTVYKCKILDCLFFFFKQSGNGMGFSLLFNNAYHCGLTWMDEFAG